MKKIFLLAILIFGVILENNAQDETINGTLTVKSNDDNILTLQSTDNIWLYTNWIDKNSVRKAYMGLNNNLTQFIIGLENGANSFAFNGGNVGIGTFNPGSWKLAVNGKIRAKEIKVETGWSDFVFFDNYKLPTLQEVENHIKKNGHLKDIPSAKEVEENGIFLGEMDAKLLQKIEELTLYTIQQEKKIQKLEKENEEMKLLNKKLLELQSRLEKLESKE